ncbi:MAG TPA: hypothetical protein VFS60_00665, partial [Thermoanaerobaculia bacterium]|nr:hypothetical protein [Thermoanaerobaculia bacterium]
MTAESVPTPSKFRIVGVPAALAAALWLSLAASPALAHDTWLLPAAAQAKPGTLLALAMTSGMAFPQEESPIHPDRIARSAVRLAGR